jgi:Bacterial protein of unknown function (DUF885)
MADDADSAFTSYATATLDGLLDRQPEWATGVGDHRHDDRLTVGTAAHYEQTSRWAGERLAGLAGADTGRLSPQLQVDAQILANQLTRLQFMIDELREHEWNPMMANPGRAIYNLLARDFAPLADRLRSAARRLAMLPESLAAARSALGPMPEIHIETALTQFAGTERLLTGELRRAASDVAGASRDLDEVLPGALEAIAEHTRWLEERLAGGRRDGFRDPRLGADLFARKLALVLDTELPLEQIVARAEAGLARASEELAAAAAEYAGPAPRGAGLLPRGAGTGSGGPDTVRAALGALAADAPDDATILGFVRDAFVAQREFVVAHDLVTVFDDPLEVIAMPEIDRGVAVAYCDSPGPLETAGLATFIAVSPTPEDWAPDRVRSFYREYNRHMVHNLMVHEAMPGHALQLQHAHRFAGGTKVRAAWRSGSFVEGWAVYAEQVMGAHGYPGEGNPVAVRTQRLKSKLRVIINAIMDARVHCDGMTQEQAMALMTGRGYQEEGEAAGKWRRVLLTSAQLSTYFVGFTEVSDLAVGLQQAHPGWPERQLHDAILAHGSPPARHLRTLLAVQPVARG